MNGGWDGPATGRARSALGEGDPSVPPAARAVAEASAALRDAVAALGFSNPISYVYNPLDYAWDGWVEYVSRYARAGVEAVLVGMNPGPWGMAQTGVPFGEVNHVHDWLRIECAIGRPKNEHPKRRVEGLSCPRSEVSGTRLWGWARKRFGTPEQFFARFFVYNYCPLMFLEASGRNSPPDKLRSGEAERLLALCDETLRRVVHALEPRYVVGVGGWAEGRIRAALESPACHEGTVPRSETSNNRNIETRKRRQGNESTRQRGKGGSAARSLTAPPPPVHVVIGRILHPSPASPAANRGWAKQAERDLRALGISLDL